MCLASEGSRPSNKRVQRSNGTFPFFPGILLFREWMVEKTGRTGRTGRTGITSLTSLDPIFPLARFEKSQVELRRLRRELRSLRGDGPKDQWEPNLWAGEGRVLRFFGSSVLPFFGRDRPGRFFGFSKVTLRWFGATTLGQFGSETMVD